jgi:hypothetical protein
LETWATFSIIDHRRPIFRQSLALFDRIVVPLPRMPIDDLTQPELDQLKADVYYLESMKAAQPYDWSPVESEKWRLAESLAAGFDPYLDTRLKLSNEFYAPDVQAIPVYGGQKQYVDATSELAMEDALTVEIMQRLPIPEDDTPLENLVNLRNTPAFRRALDDLLEWKRDKAPAILLAENRENAMAAAMRDFDKLTRAYAGVMESEGYKKAGSVASVFFTLLSGEILGAIKEGLVSFRELREPCWKKVSEMKCAAGGVVYHFLDAI